MGFDLWELGVVIWDDRSSLLIRNSFQLFSWVLSWNHSFLNRLSWLLNNLLLFKPWLFSFSDLFNVILMKVNLSIVSHSFCLSWYWSIVIHLIDDSFHSNWSFLRFWISKLFDLILLPQFFDFVVLCLQLFSKLIDFFLHVMDLFILLFCCVVIFEYDCSWSNDRFGVLERLG